MNPADQEVAPDVERSTPPDAPIGAAVSDDLVEQSVALPDYATERLNELEKFAPRPRDVAVVSKIAAQLDRRLAELDDTAAALAGWPALRELPKAQPTAPSMPAEMVPEPLRDAVVDIAERLSVHIEMIAVPLVVALGGLIGRSAAIYPKALDTWLEVPNLWGGVIGSPSSRKTPAITEAVSWLRKLEAGALEEFNESATSREAQIEILKLDIERLKREARKSGSPASIETELTEALQALKDLEVSPRRHIVNDATVEKVGELLEKNPRGLLYLRDELTGLLQSLDIPGREGDRAFLLEAYNGKGAYTYDRINRGSLHIPALTLGILGGIQPGRFKGYVRGAIAGSGQADGLVQRFQLLVWPERPPKYKNVDREPDWAANAQVEAIHKLLLELDPLSAGGELSEAGIPAFRFSGDAQVLFNRWHEELMEEVSQAEGRGAHAYEAHLGKFAGLMTSLALIFHLVDVMSGEAEGPVSLAAAELAVRWSDFLKQHAKKIYADELNVDLVLAQRLADKIKGGEITDGMKLSDLYRRRFPGLGDADGANRALSVLEAHGWVRVETIPNHRARSSEVIRFHPRLNKA